MSRHRSANNSPRRMPERIANPTIVRAISFSASSSAVACAAVNAHLGRTHLSLGMSMPRGRIVLEMPPLHGRSEYRAEHIVDVIDGLGRVSHFRQRIAHLCFANI